MALASKETTVDGIELVVWNNGKVFYKETGTELVARPINNGYMMVTLRGADGKFRPRYIHRIVSLAFHPQEGLTYDSDLQVDHIDNNPSNNRPYNLRWVTRRFNNIRRHAKMMRQKNFKRVSHSHQFVMATSIDTNEVLLFRSGSQFAQFAGVSHVDAYLALNGKVKNCAGFRVQFIDKIEALNNPELREKAERLVNRKAQRTRKSIVRLTDEEKEIKSRIKELQERGVRGIELKELLTKGRILRRQRHERVRQFRQNRIEEMKIVQLTIDGQFVKEWNGIREAMVATGMTNIYACVSGEVESTCGYKWMRKAEWNDSKNK